MSLRTKILVYAGFFVVLVSVFFYFIFKDKDMTRSNLAVINANVQDFSFIDQNGKPLTEKDVEEKVYLTEYFFTTCKGICPKMNANMRRIFEIYKNEPGFKIISHTCMPETDSVPVLKAYEKTMINGRLVKNADGSFKIDEVDTSKTITNPNWFFVTGDKAALYKMARQSYLIDNNKPDSTQLIADQFIHTQFFALVDKYRRLRGIYDGLKENEVQKMITDIDGLLKERITSKRFLGGFSNNPN